MNINFSVRLSTLAEYVDLYVDFLLTRSIAPQFDAFYRGFMNVADGPALKLFRAEELELLVVGSKVCTRPWQKINVIARFSASFLQTWCCAFVFAL